MCFFYVLYFTLYFVYVNFVRDWYFLFCGHANPAFFFTTTGIVKLLVWFFTTDVLCMWYVIMMCKLDFFTQCCFYFVMESSVDMCCGFEKTILPEHICLCVMVSVNRIFHPIFPVRVCGDECGRKWSTPTKCILLGSTKKMLCKCILFLLMCWLSSYNFGPAMTIDKQNCVIIFYFEQHAESCNAARWCYFWAGGKLPLGWFKCLNFDCATTVFLEAVVRVLLFVCC